MIDNQKIKDETELYCAGVICYATLVALRKHGAIHENHHELADDAIARYDAAHAVLYPPRPKDAA